MSDLQELRREIYDKVAEYYDRAHKQSAFVPGETKVNYGGRIYDQREMVNMVGSVLDFWLTAGPYTREFEQSLGRYLGVREVIPVNSGSSANLIAVTTLCSKQLRNRRVIPGDEVIVPATSFPTTVAPIIQNGLVPVFVDCTPGDYNIDPEQLQEAISDRTRAIMFAHTLGNPADMDRIMPIVDEHELFLIEDTCDALGSTYDGRRVGTFGDLATASFYPAHHMTLGEGGAVYTRSRRLARIARTLRDWGRDCWCGYDNPVDGKCGRRFEREVPGIEGYYDHRYYFSEIGYNLKLTDPQSAVGLAQLDKLPSFVMARKRNFKRLYDGLRAYEEHFILPTYHRKSDPSWFAFPLTVRSDAHFDRYHITKYLENKLIETRVLFAGNILRQPGFADIECRVIGDLPVSDMVLKHTFFVGVYPGLDEERIDYILSVFEEFVRQLGLQNAPLA